MKVPVLLRPLHGNSITLRELSLVYWVALTFASIMAYSLSGKPSESDPLRLFILILLSMDLAGGAIANLCHGTRSYWRSQTRTLRLTFLVLHGIHGIGIIFVFPESVVAIVVAYCWMVGAGTFLILTNNTNALTANSNFLRSFDSTAGLVMQFRLWLRKESNHAGKCRPCIIELLFGLKMNLIQLRDK